MMVKYPDLRINLFPPSDTHIKILCQNGIVDALPVSGTLRNPASYWTPVFDLLHLIAQIAFNPIAFDARFFSTNFKDYFLFVLANATRFIARHWAIKTKTLGLPTSLAKPGIRVPTNEVTTRTTSLILPLSNCNIKVWIINAVEFNGWDQTNTWFATRNRRRCIL